MQGDPIDRFRPCGAQARVGDGYRCDLGSDLFRVKPDTAQRAHRKAICGGGRLLLLGEQGQIHRAGIVCFVPQGDALFTDRYTAADRKSVV